MNRMPESAIKTKIANIFGSLGYLFCAMQWLWAVLLYFSVIQPAISYVTPDPTEKTYDVPSFSVALPHPVEMVVVAIVVIVMIAVTMYVLVKLPSTIVKTGSKAAHRATTTAVPVAMKLQHKKATKKNRLALTPKLLVIVKALLVVIPIVLTATSILLQTMPIDYSIAIVVGGVLAGITCLCFALQYLLSLVFHIKRSTLK